MNTLSNTAPTLEQFLADQAPDEDVDGESLQGLGVPVFRFDPTRVVPDMGAVRVLPPDPLERIADCLSTVAAVYRRQLDGITSSEAELTSELQRQVEDLQADNLRLGSLIDQVLAVCSKSKGKLAVDVRAVLEPDDPATAPAQSAEQPAAVEPTPEQPAGLSTAPSQDGVGHVLAPPANDASVEDWRAFAAAAGYAGDLSQANRSQIRTALGIPQV